MQTQTSKLKILVIYFYLCKFIRIQRFERNIDGTEADCKEKCILLKSKVEENLTYMKQISDTFPRQNGYLVIIKNISKQECLEI